MLMPVCGKWERQQGRSCHWHCTAPQLSFRPSRRHHQARFWNLYLALMSPSHCLYEKEERGSRSPLHGGLLGVVEAEQLLLSAEHIILAGGTHANHYLIIKQYPHTSDTDPQANNVFYHMHALNWYRLKSFSNMCNINSNSSYHRQNGWDITSPPNMRNRTQIQQSWQMANIVGGKDW